MRLPIDTKDQSSSIRISFTDQRLTAHGGLNVWSHFYIRNGFVTNCGNAYPIVRAVPTLTIRKTWRWAMSGAFCAGPTSFRRWLGCKVIPR